MSGATAPAIPSAGRPAKPRRMWGTWVLVALAIAVTIAAADFIGFDLAPLFTDTGRGWFIIQQFLQPNWAFLARTVDPWLDTLAIAILASLAGCLLALIASMLASPVTARSPWVYRTAKAVLAALRSLPDVAWALLFVAFVGIGTLAGILALIMFNLGIVAKLTAETIDAVEPGPLEAADAAGADTVQRARVAVIPQILPNYFSYAMYAFELNVRASVVIGLVGAGGIGSVIFVELARFNYANLSALVVALFVVVFVIDSASRFVRKRLIG
ncbi:phosphonate ABC transporter, permease protein PhnE [Lysobacter korlensis]|uniref:Phosphonate ABC transporter, permease protein PhnE n=1 Tax=Lysobacter korlensis TaxID=553636 RepID=A0ABV6RM07_9GAMM